jgi:predicted protein tyrosine phosphatase
LLSEFLGWVVWVYAAQDVIFLNPMTILQFLQILAAQGAWSIFGWTPTGFALWAIWGLEAITIIGASTAVAWSIVGTTPFCETCDRWIDDRIRSSNSRILSNRDWEPSDHRLNRPRCSRILKRTWHDHVRRMPETCSAEQRQVAQSERKRRVVEWADIVPVVAQSDGQRRQQSSHRGGTFRKFSGNAASGK